MWTYNYNDSLCHYGISGQKWGVRRYQNPDGTLTPEGKERYGYSQDYGDKGIAKKYILGHESGQYAFAKWRERRHEKNINKTKDRYKKIEDEMNSAVDQLRQGARDARNKGDRKKAELLEGTAKDMKSGMSQLREKRQKILDKYESKKAAQSAANANLDAYRKHSSTAKLFVQNLAMTPVGGVMYRHARARGESRLSALAELAPVVGLILRYSRDKNAYGKYIVYAEPSENGYYAVSK